MVPVTVLAHPTLLSKPTLANDLAKRLGGVWEVNHRPTGGFCRLVQESKVATLRPVSDWLPNVVACLNDLDQYINPTDPNGPRAA